MQKFLDNVVQDCGPENISLAHLVLYLLTDEDRDNRLYRPQKNAKKPLEEELFDLRGVTYWLGPGLTPPWVLEKF